MNYTTQNKDVDKRLGLKTILAVGSVGVMAAILTASTMLAYADTNPVVTGTVENSSNAVVTSAPIGSSVSDVASVASTTGPLPTGTVNFNVYSGTVCSGTSTTQSSVALVAGIATSSMSVVPNNGLSYTINYNGDATNSAVTSPCQPVIATASSTTVSNGLSTTSSVVGTSITDTAILGGATANAGGTVNYTNYSDSECSSNPQSAGVLSVVNGIAGVSNPVQFNVAGTYYWKSVYSGDTNNSAATSSCNGVTISSQPITASTTAVSQTLSTTTTTVGTPVTSLATLSGETGNATGTVNYDYSNSITCSANTQSAGTESVVNGVATSSNPITFSTPGTYYWQAMYSGDANNLSSTSTCQSLVVNAVGTTTNPGGLGSISGTVYNDLNINGVKDAGEPGLAGWTINLYNVAGWSGPTNLAPFMTTVSDVNGNYSFSNLPDGIYSIEEINQPSLHQFTSDFSPVVITNGSVLMNENFGNIAGNPNQPAKGSGGNYGNGNGNGGHGRGNDGDNDKDDSTRTTGTTITTGGNGSHGSSTSGFFQNIGSGIHSFSGGNKGTGSHH